MNEQTPRVEYRAEPQHGRTTACVYRYNDGNQDHEPVVEVKKSTAERVARELNVAVETGIRLASDHLDRDAVVKAIREFDYGDYGMDGVSYALEADPEAQEWVGDLANAVIRALGGTCA